MANDLQCSLLSRNPLSLILTPSSAKINCQHNVTCFVLLGLRGFIVDISSLGCFAVKTTIFLLRIKALMFLREISG